MSISFLAKQFKGKIVILIFSNDLLQEVMGMLIMETETMWIGRNSNILEQPTQGNKFFKNLFMKIACHQNLYAS